MTDYFKDSVYGLCEELEFNSHMMPSYVNGSLGLGSDSICWLRSALADDSYDVANLDYGSVGDVAYDGYVTGLSPACTIG